MSRVHATLVLCFAPALLGNALSACGGGAASVPAVEDTPEAAEVDPLVALNAAARAGGVVEMVHGREVADPFRALEQDNEATWAWIDAQTARTEAYLEAHADDERARRIDDLLSIGYYGDLARRGPMTFFLKREGDAEQAVLYALEAGGPAPRVLIDPNTMGERVTIDWFFPSPGGTYIAYGLSRDGDERSTLSVLDVAAAADLDEQIPRTKWCSISWLNDESGFYYTRYPMPDEPDFDAENEDAYSRHVYFHALHTDPSGDPLVFRTPERTEWLDPNVSDSDRYVLITSFRSWSESDLYLLDREATEAAPLTLTAGGDFLVYGGVRDDRLFLFSNEDHPMGRVMSAPVETAGDRSTWVELIPEGEGSIENVIFAGDRILLSMVENITATVRLYERDGTLVGDIALPTDGNVSGIGADPWSDAAVIGFDSFFYPPTLFELRDGELHQLEQVAADIDVSSYALERFTVTSRDGTSVNVFLVHRSDMPWDGQQPVLLSGYGGFSTSMTPGFQRNVLYWLGEGGVFALANIRGGGEHGEAWHRDGMLENKTNSFDDFEAAIRWLTESGLSNPDRIAIAGASNGGLLMGAMLTRCPETFRAAVSSVGLYDMVRFTDFPPAEIWMGEYGNPEEGSDFNYLIEYSPYHNVADGTAYPAALIETADQDTRVSWQHSTKFAARLQEATSAERPILFYMNRAMGHGAGTGVSDIVREYVRRYTFIETELGVR